MFKVCEIIVISKLEFFNFSGTQRVEVKKTVSKIKFFRYLLQCLWYGNESLTKVTCSPENAQTYIVLYVFQTSKLTEVNAAVKLIVICNKQRVIFVTSDKRFSQRLISATSGEWILSKDILPTSNVWCLQQIKNNFKRRNEVWDKLNNVNIHNLS